MISNRMDAEQVFVEAYPPGDASLYTHMRPLLRRLIGVPGIHHLRPLARRVDAITEPAGRLHVRYHPDAVFQGECQALTVISANLWHAYPRFTRQVERLENFACLVKEQKADVLLLQEVTRRPGLRVDEWLADQLGMAYVYSRANGHETAIGFEEGLAVLSRYPIHQLHIKQLGSKANIFVRRLALGATLDCPGGKLVAVSVHLALNRHQNAHQLTQLYHWIHSVSEGLPIIIGGDFNVGEKSAQINFAKTHWTDTYRHINPNAKGTSHTIHGLGRKILHQERLDYIFLHPAGLEWMVVDARHLDGCKGPYSDHQAVLARLAVVF